MQLKCRSSCWVTRGAARWKTLLWLCSPLPWLLLLPLGLYLVLTGTQTAPGLGVGLSQWQLHQSQGDYGKALPSFLDGALLPQALVGTWRQTEHLEDRYPPYTHPSPSRTLSIKHLNFVFLRGEFFLSFPGGFLVSHVMVPLSVFHRCRQAHFWEWTQIGFKVVLFFFNFIYLFIYLSMAVLGLCVCARAFSSCGKWGPLFIAVCGPLTIVASLVAEHRLQTRRLSNCGSWA